MKLLVIITCAVEIILRLQIFKLIVANYPDFRKVRKYKAEQEFKTKYEAHNIRKGITSSHFYRTKFSEK